MAVRDRNLFAWQAYVITMSFVSVGLLLGMFFLWRGYSDLNKRLEDKTAELATASTAFTTSEARVDRLLSMVGVGGKTENELNEEAARFANDEKLAPVEKEFAELMNLFAPGVTGGSERNLIKLPKYLIDTVRLRNEDIDKARERETQLLAEKTATLQRETQAREAAEAAQKAAEADLAATRAQNAEAIATLNAEKKEVLESFDKYKRTFDTQLATLSGKNQELTTANSTLMETVEKKSDELTRFTTLSFAEPQGAVIRTANGGTMVWIDLGRDDGLREGVAFTVIDESTVNTSEAKGKAHLVITRVIQDSQHLSQARVTDADPTQPLMTGDKVFSPAWRPGRTIGFALVGEMDINGDYKDDVGEVRELIRRSGGKVDAEMDSKGNIVAGLTGMTPNTEYLVLGTDLGIIKGDNPEELAKQAAYEKFRAEARRNGIIQISVDKLLGYLKADQAQKVVPLGDRIQGKDFPAEFSHKPLSSRGSVSDIFQPRNPSTPRTAETP
ncbi:MAG: hypothetical protein KDA72_08945 [Planctomycetales bacterium]|nr:hypothetical protein [Planctomycetales bacterium]